MFGRLIVVPVREYRSRSAHGARRSFEAGRSFAAPRGRRLLTETDLGRWVRTVVAGRPACIFAADVEDARNAVEQVFTSESEPARVVALSWDEVPPLGNELGLLVEGLARAALQLFPFLYGLTQGSRERWTASDIETESHAISRRVPEVLGAACRQILLACREGRAPLVPKLSSGEQAHQLALAVEPQRLVVLIAVLKSTVANARLRALAQGAEWLASNTHSRVLLVLPEAFRDAEELDHVAHTACVYPRVRSASPVPERKPVVPARKSATQEAAPKVFVSAVFGQPHPKSDAERELHAQLSVDPELRLLFSYNQPVATRFETKPTVDLLWDEGRLVIEIDGDDHRGVLKFSQDRRRDYELVLSGYRVVRFTRSRVVESTGQVVQEIRDAVRHCRRETP